MFGQWEDKKSQTCVYLLSANSSKQIIGSRWGHIVWLDFIAECQNGIKKKKRETVEILKWPRCEIKLLSVFVHESVLTDKWHIHEEPVSYILVMPQCWKAYAVSTTPSLRPLCLCVSLLISTLRFGSMALVKSSQTDNTLKNVCPQWS